MVLKSCKPHDAQEGGLRSASAQIMGNTSSGNAGGDCCGIAAGRVGLGAMN